MVDRPDCLSLLIIRQWLFYPRRTAHCRNVVLGQSRAYAEKKQGIMQVSSVIYRSNVKEFSGIPTWTGRY